ncbi:MAG: MFS transporter [Burkholderiales bacterium]|nr:MFS transporter [Burkholderiales bacterium]MDE2456602.1 MFS transporter [Burkholderiales bacterium]
MKPARPNPLLEVGVTIIVPALVLMQFTERLGELPALLLALAFPVGWALWQGLRRRSLNGLAAVGIVSTLLTGGIGLLHLDAGWLAVKEAAVSALIGLVIALSAWTRRPLIHALIFDAALLDVPRLQAALAERRNVQAFEARLRQGTLLLAATFFFAAVANYFLTRWIVHSPAGTPAFNDELGRLTLLGYPLIALPTMALMAALLYWLAAQARRLSGIAVADLFGSEP